MERQIPKNVRQIGNVSDTPKIYVEDYVDTFFAQLCEKAGEEPVGAFLVGDLVKADETDYVYIYGAIQMHELKLEGKEYVLDENTWKQAYEDCKQYFEDGEMLGWFVAHSGVPLTAESSTVKLHKKSFPKDNTVFILKDPIEKEEVYFIHKLNDLMEAGGHFTYYEKNPCMQNYMISTRKKNGVCPSETVEDRAAKDFRSLVRSCGEYKMQKRTSHLMYGMSACLVLLVVIMGVVTVNNVDKMRSVQSVISSIGGAGSGDENRMEVRETSGNASAVTQDGQALGDGIQTDGADADGQSQENGGVSGQQGNPASDDAQTDGTQGDGVQGDGAQGDGTQTDGSQTDGSQTDGLAGTTEAANAAGGFNGSDGIYVVEAGDTLAMISKKMYGDISHTESISKMNGLSDGNLIYIGQKLLLP